MSALKTPLPERKRTYRFALTPLADAMFQLLIFFMLSTSLTPYSLITLRTAADGVEEQANDLAGLGKDPARPAATSQGRITFWTLGAGSLSVAGQEFDTDQLPDLAEAVGSQDAPGTVVIVVTNQARIQDVASAMAALRNAEVEAVQITTEGGG